MRNSMLRNLIKDSKDFTSFRLLLPTGGKKGKSPAVSKKGSKSEDSSIVLKTAAKEGTIVHEFLSAIDWTEDQFKAEVNATFAMMGKSPFKREDRLSNRLGSRLLTMCGVPWNLDSHNKLRDWTPLAVAVTLESAMIQNYRGLLFRHCPWACSLRNELQDLFYSFTKRHTTMGQQGKAVNIREWQFPDNISVVRGPFRDPPGLEELKTLWQEARAGYVKDEKDSISAIIQALEKSPYLACSDPEAPAGTIETLAHDLITSLINVSSILSRALSSFISSTDHVHE